MNHFYMSRVLYNTLIPTLTDSQSDNDQWTERTIWGKFLNTLLVLLMYGLTRVNAADWCDISQVTTPLSAGTSKAQRRTNHNHDFGW